MARRTLGSKGRTLRIGCRSASATASDGFWALLLRHVLESLERPDLNDFTSGLCLEDLLLLGERVDTLALRGRGLENNHDLQQPWQSKDARTFLAYGSLDLAGEGIEHRCHL